MMIPSPYNNIKTFSSLYDQYAPALYGIILEQTPDVDVAGNILVNSFVKIWSKVKDYDGPKGKLFSMMLSITMQECKTSADTLGTWFDRN